MIKYPNGKVFNKNNAKKVNTTNSLTFANRGMNLEDSINKSNEYYLSKGICCITKRPTPINIVKVDYSKGARITDAYFEKQSTTDYNGVYKGKYIDFEAKSTKNKTSFPLSNISKHQIEHLKNVIYHKGIAFFIISFETMDEIYLLDAKYVIDFYEHNTRKSIPYSIIKNEGDLLEKSFNPRIKYIEVLDKKYF